jgi:hypothetical protein
LKSLTRILLTQGEKLATLNRWRRSILGELDAPYEGMATRGYASEQLTVLEEIEQAKAHGSAAGNQKRQTEEGSKLLRWKDIL